MVSQTTKKSIALPLDEMASTAAAYASATGVQVATKKKKKKTTTTSNGDDKDADDKVEEEDILSFTCAPMSLLPNAYPKTAFDEAVSLAPVWNELVDKISRDSDFLQTTLKDASQNDPYTAKLLQLYKEIYVNDSNNDNDDKQKKPNFAKDADRLGLHRSDYMLHRSDNDQQYRIKQVELNTIASSFGALAAKVAALHRYLTSRFGHDSQVKAFLQTNQKAVLGGKSNSDAPGVPSSPALERLSGAMQVAVQRYRERFATKTSKRRLVVLFVVQPGETNTVDQRLLEFAMFEKHQIPVVRMSLAEIQAKAKLDAKTGALPLRDDQDEVAVVYFRAGYAPADYPDGMDGVEWQARETLERSRATCSPSLGYHLAGTKKVQQALARPGALERFFPDDADKVEAARACMAGLYSLGREDAVDADLLAVQDVLEGGQDRYVLKPQREGGGYNFYGQDLLEKLQQNVTEDGEDGDADGGKKTTAASSSSATSGFLCFTSSAKAKHVVDHRSLRLDASLGEYILMERLFPPQQNAVLMRAGNVEGSGATISELGCFGTVVADSEGKIVHNEYAGFLLRTKFANVDEGGVASGFATLSSPYLC